jgi:hypothetical protein
VSVETMTGDGPNPGSDEAFALGCRCPRIDNNYGKGYRGQPGIFVFSGGCPLHCPEGEIALRQQESRT